MAFQWLQIRLQEERERRELQARHLARLPGALQELHDLLVECIESYKENFGESSADIVMLPNRIQVTVREERAGNWQQVSTVEVVAAPEMPGFLVKRGEHTLEIEVGLLPSDKLFYRDRAQDKYIAMDELTRRVLDRALFPALPEQ